MPAPALRDIQGRFWRSLHTGEADAGLTAVVLPTPTQEPAERVQVYQGMYFWRLFEVLREDYPKTYETLGDDAEELVRRYLAEHPSEHPSVRHLGRHFPAFLAAVGAEPAWLSDLARLELARVEVFDAPDAVPVRTADLCAVSPGAWADLAFTTIPSLAVLRCRHPIHQAWTSPMRADLPENPSTLRVWRQDFAVFHCAIEPLEEAALAGLIAGRPFGEICEAVAEHVPPEAAAAQASSLLARWVEDGLISALAS